MEDFENAGLTVDMTLDDFLGSPPRDDPFLHHAEPDPVIPEDHNTSSPKGAPRAVVEPVVPTIILPEDQAKGPTPTVDAPSADASPAVREEVSTGPGSSLQDLVKSLLSDNDPSQLIIQIEVRSILSSIDTIVKAVLNNAFPPERLKRFLDPRISLLQDEGCSELAQAFTDEIDRLVIQLRGLQDLESAGPSSYVAARMKTRLAVWREGRAVVEMDVQLHQNQASQLEVAVHQATSSVHDFQCQIAATEAKAMQLEQELQAAREDINALVLGKASAEGALAKMSDQFGSIKRKLAELEEEARRTLSTSEESFTANLQIELQQAFFNEISALKQQLCNRQFDV